MSQPIMLDIRSAGLLRSEYFQRHFDDLKKLSGVPETMRALPRAPELLTCLALRAETGKVPYFVYPDPPLAKQELDLLTELDPNLRLIAPTKTWKSGRRLEDRAFDLPEGETPKGLRRCSPDCISGASSALSRERRELFGDRCARFCARMDFMVSQQEALTPRQRAYY